MRLTVPDVTANVLQDEGPVAVVHTDGDWNLTIIVKAVHCPYRPMSVRACFAHYDRILSAAAPQSDAKASVLFQCCGVTMGASKVVEQYPRKIEDRRRLFSEMISKTTYSVNIVEQVPQLAKPREHRYCDDHSDAH